MATVTRVYLIISLFIVLILGLVLLFQFQMDASVAMRVYAGGEGLWAKAQKDAVNSLEQYIVTRDEADYQSYLRWIQVPLGDRQARLALQQANPDIEIARAGYLQGRNHPVDIEYAITFFLRFQHIPQMARVIEHWTQADRHIAELVTVAEVLHDEIVSGHASPQSLRAIHARLQAINREVTVDEDQFSFTLAEASRWANDISRKLAYTIALLFAALGIALSWPIIARIRTTEGELFEGEQKFRSITTSAFDAIVMIDDAGKTVFFNEAAEKMFGYSAEEVTGKEMHPLLAAPRFLEAYHQAFPHFVQSGEGAAIGKVVELVARRRDGSEFPIELSLSAMRIKGHWHAVGIIRDITGRKQIEEKISKQQELLEQIIETIPIRVFWKDRNLRYLGCNTLFAKDAGFSSPDELIGKTDFDTGWKDQAELYRADDQRVMDSNTPRLSYDEPQTTPDGRRIWLRTSKVPLCNVLHETIGMLGVYEDITERKQAEQTLEESERKFRVILDSAVDGILVADGQTHRFVTANLAICDMLGYLPEEIYKLALEDIHPAEALPDVQHQFERQMAGAIRVAPNLPVKRKDGSVFFADVSASPMFLSGQHFLVGVFHDVTERRQAEEKIRKVNEELEEKVQERTSQLIQAQDELLRKEKLAVLGQVAGSVGHELRNPLGVMSNAVYFLQTVLDDAGDSVKEYLGIIKNEITSSERIVSDLLDSVRTKPPHPEAVGLRPLIEQTLRKIAVPPSVTVELDIPDCLPLLQVDPQQIHQIFRNLISNGVEAMPAGGKLQIVAVENSTDRTITVSVRDTGVGMTEEQLGKLFQPLFTTKARGIGLGLVVVKNLTQANGGSIAVQSAVGQGTTFSVTLPRAGEESGTS